MFSLYRKISLYLFCFSGRLESGDTPVIVRSVKFQPNGYNHLFVFRGISLNITENFELENVHIAVFRLEGPLTLGPGTYIYIKTISHLSLYLYECHIIPL